MPEKSRLNVRLSATMYDRLKTISVMQGIPMCVLVEFSLLQFFKENNAILASSSRPDVQD